MERRQGYPSPSSSSFPLWYNGCISLLSRLKTLCACSRVVLTYASVHRSISIGSLHLRIKPQIFVPVAHARRVHLH